MLPILFIRDLFCFIIELLFVLAEGDPVVLCDPEIIVDCDALASTKLRLFCSGF